LRYNLIVHPRVEKSLAALPPTARERILDAFDFLCEDPRPHGAIKMKMTVRSDTRLRPLRNSGPARDLRDGTFHVALALSVESITCPVQPPADAECIATQPARSRYFSGLSPVGAVRWAPRQSMGPFLAITTKVLIGRLSARLGQAARQHRRAPMRATSVSVIRRLACGHAPHDSAKTPNHLCVRSIHRRPVRFVRSRGRHAEASRSARPSAFARARAGPATTIPAGCPVPRRLQPVCAIPADSCAATRGSARPPAFARLSRRKTTHGSAARSLANRGPRYGLPWLIVNYVN
jgi:hypothetical protein